MQRAIEEAVEHERETGNCLKSDRENIKMYHWI
jgi:hypothetical protein